MFRWNKVSFQFNQMEAAISIAGILQDQVSSFWTTIVQQGILNNHFFSQPVFTNFIGNSTGSFHCAVFCMVF